MKKLSRKISYRFRVFAVYLLVAFIPIMLIIGVVENRYVRRLRDDVTNSLDSSVDTVVKALDGSVENIHATVRSLIRMDVVKQNYHPSSPVEANELRDTLSIFVYDSTLFGEIALYSSNSKYLFTNLSSYTCDLFWKVHGIAPTTEDVNTLIQQAYGVVFLPTDGEQNAFCALYSLHNVGRQKGLIFTMPASKLTAILQDALGDNQGYCQLTDASGRVLFSYSTDGEIPSQEILAACAAGETTVRSGVNTVYCAQGISDDAGLTVSMVVTGGAVHDTLNSIRLKWGVLIVMTIALCFVASWVTSFINTKPIVELSRKISSSKIRERERWTNEIEHIDASIRHLSESATAARRQVGELSDYLTFRLLCGTIESAENANQLSQVLGTSIYADAYQVCVMDLGKDHTVSEIRQELHSMLPPEISCLTRAYGRVFACVFFCGLEDENAMDVFSDELLRRYPKGRLAFGNSYSRLEDIPISFVEAYLASQNQESSVTAFSYTDIQVETIQRFREVIQTNDIARILASIQDVCRNMEQRVYTAADETCICANMFHMLSDCTLAGRLADGLPNAYILISTDSSEKLLKLFEPVIGSLEAMLSAHMDMRKDPPLVDQLKEYLLANYRNSNFSLQQMAFDFRMTPPMLSHYFKEHYGRNINEYLNDMKMERARTLLLETSLSVYDVGLELGYQGPNSFIRRFKATYGITPGEFRQNKANED